MREIWVAGYPSRLGGADTELDHMIDLWTTNGVDVHLVPLSPIPSGMQRLCEERGCVTHSYQPEIFRDKVVVSFCNADFLNNLPEIAKSGRPAVVVWANCMTWTFDRELECHQRGLIDRFIFQSEYQRSRLVPQLSTLGPVRQFEGYRPYFSLENKTQRLRFRSERSPEYFGVGRVSRDDPTKYPTDTWRMFAKVSAPQPVKTFMLGFGTAAAAKCGRCPPCDWLDWMYWPPGAIPVADFFDKIHVLVHVTGGSGENWPRVILEAWASGVAVVVEDGYGTAEMVDHMKTGLVAESTEHATFLASQLAFNEELRRELIRNSLHKLKTVHADARTAMRPFNELFSECSPAQEESSRCEHATRASHSRKTV